MLDSKTFNLKSARNHIKRKGGIGTDISIVDYQHSEFSTFNPNKQQHHVLEDTALARDSARRFLNHKAELAKRQAPLEQTKTTYEESFLSDEKINVKYPTNESFNVRAFTQNKNNKIIITAPNELDDENSHELSPIRKNPATKFETITKPMMSKTGAFNTVRMGPDPSPAQTLFQTRRDT